MKKLGYIFILAVLTGCAKAEPIPERTLTEEKLHAVTLPLSVVSPLTYESQTEPMTRADGNTKLGPMRNTYRYVVCKKVGSVWVVDLIGDALLKTDKGTFYDFNAVSSDIFDDLKLELRPGEYHIVVTANSGSVSWNGNLTVGTPVRSEDGSLAAPWLFQYKRGDEEWRPNYGWIGLQRDVFTGTADFTVTKTGDLHSAASGIPVKIEMSRINCWYRVLLREDTSLPEQLAFKMDTPNSSDITLESLDEKGFPYGVDAWGEAWYPVPAETELRFYVSSGYVGFRGKDGRRYSVVMPNATYFYPMIIGDKNRTEGHKYKIKTIIVGGQSGHMTTIYQDPGVERLYRANSYSGIVLEATDEVRETDPDYPTPYIVAREGAAPNKPSELFDDFYEWNN